MRYGFHTLPAETRRLLQARGGANVAADKRSFSRYPSLAKAAGRKGGLMNKGRKRRPRIVHSP